MSVRAANSATFDFNENVVVADFGNFVLLKFESLFFDKHRDSCFFGNRPCRRLGSGSVARSHSGKHLSYDRFDTAVIHIIYNLLLSEN